MWAQVNAAIAKAIATTPRSKTIHLRPPNTSPDLYADLPVMRCLSPKSMPGYFDEMENLPAARGGDEGDRANATRVATGEFIHWRTRCSACH
jgi:hypothetical protein